MTQHKYEIRACNPQTTSNLLWIGGRVGTQLAHRDCFELVKDGAVVWQVAIQWELKSSPFQAQLVWTEANAVLFGAHHEVYALAIDTGSVLLHQTLDSYFGSFELSNLLLILTGQEIMAFDEQLNWLWSTSGLAVDGIVCQEIGETITVDAEMDPPGGWEQVTIDLRTGAELTRGSRQKQH